MMKLYSLLLKSAFSRQSRQLSTLSVSLDANFSFSRASLRLSETKHLSVPTALQKKFNLNTMRRTHTEVGHM